MFAHFEALVRLLTVKARYSYTLPVFTGRVHVDTGVQNDDFRRPCPRATTRGPSLTRRRLHATAERSFSTGGDVSDG